MIRRGAQRWVSRQVFPGMKFWLPCRMTLYDTHCRVSPASCHRVVTAAVNRVTKPEVVLRGAVLHCWSSSVPTLAPEIKISGSEVYKLIYLTGLVSPSRC